MEVSLSNFGKALHHCERHAYIFTFPSKQHAGQALFGIALASTNSGIAEKKRHKSASVRRAISLGRNL